MRIKAIILVLPLVLLLGGCPNTKSFKMDKAFTTTIGQTRYNQDHKLGIVLDKIEADSRCPVDVNCAWAGEVNVRAEIYWNDLTTKRTLNFGGIRLDDDKVQFQKFNIQIIEVKPKPYDGVNIEQSDYRFKLRIWTDA